MPSEIGQVTQRYEAPHHDASTKTLILIQDAHVNYDAQKHLAGILDRLASLYGISLIMVESGEGDMGLSALRHAGTTPARLQVAEQYLREGTISGEEYLDIVSEHPLVLWGVDDLQLYEHTMQRFLEADSLSDQISQPLARLRRLVEQLKARAFNDALRAFETETAQLESGALNFQQYEKQLIEASRTAGLALTAYPHLSDLLTVAQLEPELDTPQVEEEQRRVVEHLRSQADPNALERLKEASARIKAGTAESGLFYEELESLMTQAHVAVAEFPHLARYLQYAKLKSTLEPNAWRNELIAFQREIRAHLARSADETALLSLSDRTANVERLAHMQWSIDDYHSYRKEPEAFQVSTLVTLAREQASRSGVPFDWQDQAEVLDERLARIVLFYEAAAARETVMAQRTVRKLDESGAQAAVLIVGGFHTDRLIELMAPHNVNVAVITPWVGEEGPERYTEVLKSKYAQYVAQRSRSDTTVSSPGVPTH